MSNTISHKTVVTDHFNSYSRSWHDRLKRHPFEIRYKAVQNILHGVSPSVALDIGCGTGDYSRLFDADATRYTGYDISPDMIGECRTLHPNYRFEVADAEQIPEPDGAADVTLSIAVIEYYNDPVPFVRELARVTRDGGLIVVAVPNGDNRSRGWLAALGSLLNSPLARTLKQLLRRRPSTSAEPRPTKNKNVFHTRYGYSAIVNLGSDAMLTVAEHAYVSVRMTPFARLDEWLSEKISGRPGWAWLTRSTATILVCAFRKSS